MQYLLQKHVGKVKQSERDPGANCDSNGHFDTSFPGYVSTITVHGVQ
jgi:hypothetical protein